MKVNPPSIPFRSPAAQGDADAFWALPEGTPAELIEGKIEMAPAPKLAHQFASRQLTAMLEAFLRENPIGELLYAPVDVVFSETTVLQPDHLVVLNENLHKLGEYHVAGAPDWVSEILSPSTERRDLTTKRLLYGKYGVKEFWVIDPQNKAVEVFNLKDNRMISEWIFLGDEVAESRVIPGFRAPLPQLFRVPEGYPRFPFSE